ncbi:hypothetical protein [Halopenitus malekzadehii]|uniref:hypothetical protein n=1 Tax=Halopenitus malekzadehii TaxID=1267564 RepID=UPI000B8900C2|nr:hypothetical protein [Halopenitus malekzadehii]
MYSFTDGGLRPEFFEAVFLVGVDDGLAEFGRVLRGAVELEPGIGRPAVTRDTGLSASEFDAVETIETDAEEFVVGRSVQHVVGF